MMSHFWTVKIAGVSGTGKTTVMESLQQNPELPCESVVYSRLLKAAEGDQEVADTTLSNTLAKANGLVLMDDHLEFDNPNKTRNYLNENTRGIVLLDVPLHDLILRVQQDPNRSRDIHLPTMSQNLQASRRKAMRLAHETKTPLLVVPNLHGDLERSIILIRSFVQYNSP